MRKTLLLLVPVLLLGACSWGITLDDAAKNVRTAWSGDVSSCRELGKVTVSVMNRVGPVDRNDIKVRDELEVLAPRVPVRPLEVRDLTWLPEPDEDDPAPAPQPVATANRSCALYVVTAPEPVPPGAFLRARVFRRSARHG